MALNKRLITAVVLTLVVLVAAVLFGRRGPSTSETPPLAPALVAPPLQVPSASGSDLSRPAENMPPPWATGAASVPLQPQAGSPPLDQAMAGASAQKSPRDLKELEKMQQDLAESMRGGQAPDPKKVEAMLNQLKQKHGSTVAGVNLDLVIKNLQVAQELQVLALEIQGESAKPGGGDNKKMQAYIAQLTKLQSQLRTDITVPPAPPAAK